MSWKVIYRTNAAAIDGYDFVQHSYHSHLFRGDSMVAEAWEERWKGKPCSVCGRELFSKEAHPKLSDEWEPEKITKELYDE